MTDATWWHSVVELLALAGIAWLQSRTTAAAKLAATTAAEAKAKSAAAEAAALLAVDHAAAAKAAASQAAEKSAAAEELLRQRTPTIEMLAADARLAAETSAAALTVLQNGGEPHA